MKQRLLLLLALVLWGVQTSVVLADDAPSVAVVEDVSSYDGTEPYVFNQKDGKVYVRNNIGTYERYGVYEKASVLKVAGGGATEIEYIESTVDGEHPYINTDYIHKANTRIVADVNLTANADRAYEAVFGARRNITNNALIFFSRFNNDEAGCYARATQEARGNITLPMGERITIDVFEQTLSVYTADDAEEPFAEIITENGADDGTHPLYIFDLNNGGNRDNSCGYFKLYGFKIYEGEELVMDLKPFVSSTGDAGLLDKVSGKQLLSANGAKFTVSPDGEAAASSAGVTVYEGKMFFNTTDNLVYKYTNGAFQSLGARVATPIEGTDYKNMETWQTNAGHASIFENSIEYEEREDANYIDNYIGTAGYEPLMTQIETEPDEDYNFMFNYVGCKYDSWHNVPMHVFVTNRYDLNTNEAGAYVGGDVLATFECPFEGTNEEEVPVSLDFTAQQEKTTIVAQFGDCNDGFPFWFEFRELLVQKYTYPEKYPVLNPFAPQLALLIPEAEAFEGNIPAALATALKAAAAEGKSALDGDDMVAQKDALEKLQAVLGEARSADLSELQQFIAWAEAKGVDATAAKAAAEEALTAAEVSQALFNLKAAAKIHALRQADLYTGAAPAVDTEFYLFNIGTGLFLSAGSDWNTHAAVDQAGWPVTLEAVEGGYVINNSMGSFNNSPYIDTGVRTTYTFQFVEGSEATYNILEGERLLGWNPQGHTDGRKYWSSISNTEGADPADPNFQWKLITRAERENLLAAATAEEPVDATFYINNPSLHRLPGLDMWEKQAEGGNGGARVSSTTDGNDNRADDFAYEFWNTDAFTFAQTVEGLKPGLYRVSVNAFYRDGDGAYQAGVVNNGEPLLRLAYLFANEEQTPLVNIANAEVFNGVPNVASQASDKGNIPNWPAEAVEYFQNGYYLNELQVIVGEDGILNLGIAKDEKANFGDWVVLDNFRLTYLGEAKNFEKDIYVDRYVGQGYGAQQVEVDLDPAKEFLGVDALTTAMLRIVNPDGTQIADYEEFDGWFNGEGVATTWGANTQINVKFFEAIPDGVFSICDMNDADKAGATYKVRWALTANDRTYFYNIYVTFANKPAVDLTFENLNVIDEQKVDFTSETGKFYEGFTADVDVAAILAKLEVESLEDVTIYAVQPDGSLDDNYKVGNTDGWRNAEGAWQGWGDEAYFYVKADFSRESTQIYEVGGMEGKHTDGAASYTATYAFVKNETTDAVVLKVNLTYEIGAGIQAVETEQGTVIFDLSGRKVNRAQKGIYIVNGQKAVVK